MSNARMMGNSESSTSFFINGKVELRNSDCRCILQNAALIVSSWACDGGQRVNCLYFRSRVCASVTWSPTSLSLMPWPVQMLELFCSDLPLWPLYSSCLCLRFELNPSSVLPVFSAALGSTCCHMFLTDGECSLQLKIRLVKGLETECRSHKFRQTASLHTVISRW